MRIRTVASKIRGLLFAGALALAVGFPGPGHLDGQTPGGGAQLEESSFEPLVMGWTFTLESNVLGETRRINVYAPAAYDRFPDREFPVLYMPDGGIQEDFLHLAGLVQISSLNGTMRPFILVGIENTERRRDLTPPTSTESDLRIAPRVGGSAAFRSFIEAELMPAIDRGFRTSGETAIIGESLAGLFVVETLLLQPGLFDTYIAVDPSLWWDGERLVGESGVWDGPQGRKLHLATSRQAGIREPTNRLADALKGSTGVSVSFLDYPKETHATIYHPAALDAVRAVFPMPERESRR